MACTSSNIMTSICHIISTITIICTYTHCVYLHMHLHTHLMSVEMRSSRIGVTIWFNNQSKSQDIRKFIFGCTNWRNGILLPKLFWPTVRKNCSTDWEKFLKFEAEGREFAKILRSLEQFIQTVKGQNNFIRMLF